LTKRKSTKAPIAGSICESCCLPCGRFPGEAGLTGPFVSRIGPGAAWWGVGWGTGQGGSVGAKPEPDFRRGSLGCLEECVEARGCPGWRASGQAQVAKNLADDRGIFNGRQDDQGAAALRTGGEVDGETRLSNCAQLMRAREEVEERSPSPSAVVGAGSASPGTI